MFTPHVFSHASSTIIIESYFPLLNACAWTQHAHTQTPQISFNFIQTTSNTYPMHEYCIVRHKHTCAHTHTQFLSCCMLLQCLGVDVGDRWTKVRKCFESHLDNRALVWYDTHLMMSLAHGTPGSEPAAKFALAEHLIKVR